MRLPHVCVGPDKDADGSPVQGCESNAPTGLKPMGAVFAAGYLRGGR